MNLSDEKLYQLCKYYGKQALRWRQKFCGLLPEVYKRKLYGRKGFFSIFEFAKKLAGLSEDHVRRILNVEKNLQDKPILHQLLVDGEVSVNKLARVVSVATNENEEFLANQLKILPKKAIETLVRDEKVMMERVGGGSDGIRRGCGSCNQDGLFEPGVDDESVPGHRLSGRGYLQLSPAVQQKLFELQQKGIDIDELLLEFLKKREEKISKEFERVRNLEKNSESASRSVSVKIKRILSEEYGTKCSIPTCNKPAKIIHHTQRFAISQNHDPYFLAPLCYEHHLIAHSVDLQFQRKRRT